MTQHGEASVEEILESIKKVIARDSREAGIAPRSSEQPTGGPNGASGASAAGGGEERDILDLATAEFAQPVSRDSDEPADPDAPDASDDAEGDSAPLTTEAVRRSMRENFEALATLAEPGARPQIVRSGETSLEGLVRDMLRPMLAEWLDANLPAMVERLVKAEIARIAGKRG